MYVNDRIAVECPATGLSRRAGRVAVIFLVSGAFRCCAAEQAKPSDSSAAAQDQALGLLCVDANGKAVARAEVHLFQNVVGDSSRYKHFGPYTSDEQGRVTCPRAVVYDGRGHFDRWAYACVPGRLVGIARSANWKNHSVINPEFRIQLQPSRSVEGMVTVPEGVDPAEVTVRVKTLNVKTGPGNFEYQSFPRYLPFAGLDTALPAMFDKRPDAEGHIRFDDVPARGSLFLVTAGTGLAEAQWRNENNAFDEPIRLTISKEGVLTGRVLSPDGKPAPAMKVAAQLSFIPGRQIFHLSTFRATTDENGEFALHGMPEIPFVLSVEDPSHQWTVRPRERLSVASGETKNVTVSMEAPVVVSGRVFDP